MVRDGLFPNAVVLQSIHRSLRGTAADILLHLGGDVKVDDLLRKLGKVFGNTLPPEAILVEFYLAKQRESEKVAMWVCRLETILSKLPIGTFTPDASKGMLRTKFYSGLRLSVMCNALRHSFDGRATYEDLLVAARVAEREHELENASARVNQATAIDSGLSKKMDQFLSSLEKVQTRLDKLESRQISAVRLQVVSEQNRSPWRLKNNYYVYELATAISLSKSLVKPWIHINKNWHPSWIRKT